MKRYQIFEILGMLLILGATFLQLFISLPLKQDEGERKELEIARKLEQIHDRQLQLQRDITAKLIAKASGNDIMKYYELDDDWNSSVGPEAIARLSDQNRLLNCFIALIFISGSLLLIISKLMEYNISRETCEQKDSVVDINSQYYVK